MRYTVTTFKVDLEVCEPGMPARSSEDAWRFSDSILKDLDADKEHFVVLVLNNKNRVEGFKVISTGTLTACLVHPREVYSAVLCPEWRMGCSQWRAAAVIFLHNHPSGEPAPSQEDIEITRRLKEIGDLFGIRVLDHIIRGHEPHARHYSFSDRGLL